MAKKKVKVRDLATKFGISPSIVLEEAAKEGFELKSAASVIPEDILELVEEHINDIVEENRKNKLFKKKDNEENSNEEVHVKPPLIVKNIAEVLDKKPNEVISALMKMNVFASINQNLTQDVAEKLCESFGFKLVVDRREKEEHLKGGDDTPQEIEPEEEDKPEDLITRPAVVTFMGHVDHGKTSLQDKVRQTNVVSGEAGGITQHIGASTVTHNGKKITFIDTPGHEAFTAMRARGADVTDIVILVVAADDAFMPQTVEALNHARAAKVPIIVAVNKMDLPNANFDKVVLQMQQNNLMSEEWGGEIGTIKVSAMTGEGIDDLLDRISLEAEMLELKANPKRRAEGYVLEAQLEQGLGPTANMLITNGTLKIGDPVVCDEYYGKVKAMLDEKGVRMAEAGPSTPIKLVGLSGVPQAGSKFVVTKSDKDARAIAENRGDISKEERLTQKAGVGGLEALMAQFDKNQRNDLNVIIKGDVQGSVEAIIDSFKKLPSEKISVEVVMSGVGPITENDVLLASASQAMIVGFHVKVNTGVNKLAKEKDVEIHLYSVIYELIENITEALSGRLEPEKREKPLGSAEIRQIFSMTKGPKVCGCYVEKGSVKVGAKARVHRGDELIFNGQVQSLRRFQDDVKEVKQGLECGIRLENFLDFQEGDKIEIYEITLKKATL